MNELGEIMHLMIFDRILDDYGEIRQNLYDSLGPNANDFANEFMQKKRELDILL